LFTGAEPERVIREIEEIIGLDCSNIIRASAKMGLGIEETLEAVVERIPPPKNTVKVSKRTLQANQKQITEYKQL
jgi:GTP-binding protein LepA